MASTLFSQEIEYLEIPLSGEAGDKSLEMSGLTWYGDSLILMPQNINWKSPAFYYLTKNEILKWIKGDKEKSLSPKRLSLILPDFRTVIPGYQGFEAICFMDNQAAILIESKSKQGMVGFLAKGYITGKPRELVIDAQLRTINPPVEIKNMAFESILYTNSKIMAFFEANGSEINTGPKVELFSTELKPMGSRPFPFIEYRITDVTAVDDRGRFWALNFFWPGEKKILNPGADIIAEKFGIGNTHKLYNHVERLIELQITPTGIVLTDTAPVQLKLDREESHNWEGLARLDNLGFILVTDEYPRTILAFVPFSSR
ncbi:MAG: hypothetical protein V3S48_01315 [Candidatus Neomarinimicrobiota bacterium]